MAPEPAQTPKTIKDFGHALGRYLPLRLAQLRTIGKITRERVGGKGKR